MTDPKYSSDDRNAWISYIKQQYAEYFAELDELGIWYEFAEYRPQTNWKYRGNPLIATLPAVLSEVEIREMLKFYPPIPANIKSLPYSDRRVLVNDLKMMVHPFDIHFDYYQRISEAIREGYVSRNPFKSTKQKSARERKRARRRNELSGNVGLFGSPGMGKTTLCHEILNMFPQIIFHWRFENREFLQTQLVWLIVDCPPSASRSDFADAFYHAVDAVMPNGTYYDDYAAKSPVRLKISNIPTVCRNLHLGLLAFDETQRLSKVRGGGPKLLLDLLVDLWNKTRIPTFYLGTYNAISLVKPNVHFNRRLIDGDITWPCMEEPDWNSIDGTISAYLEKMASDDEVKSIQGESFLSLLQTLDLYNYLCNPFKIDADIGEALYEFSQGITSLVVNLFILAQKHAIDSAEGKGEKEVFNGDIVRSTGAIHHAHLQAALDALESGDASELELFDDLSTEESHPYKDQPQPKPNDSSQSKNEKKSIDSNVKTPNPNGSSSNKENKKPKPIKKKKSSTQKRKRSSQIIVDDHDLRTIAELGKEKNNWTAYQSLKNAGFVCNFDEFFADPDDPFAVNAIGDQS